MRNIKLTLITVFFIAFNLNNAQSKGQYDSLRIKISQLLIFGIQDIQKVMEADSMLEKYSDKHLGGIILFEKILVRKDQAITLKS